MRRLLLAAAGLALLIPAGLSQTAWAQTAPGAAPAAQATPAGQTGPMGGPGMPPPPPGGPRGPGAPGGPGMMPPPPPPSRAAHFHLQRGDAVVDVKCADDDSTKGCADIVNAMLDKLAALPVPAARN
ncbi:hypothetical protein D3273_11280 [Lichenibacterium minor]|uniref:Uncharacterized protein n=1 Tax=Lichenibacterium minor TaxID=2316528 RepID=A0A4Q2UA72_9HYPH|nr:hypothetical protein [Lichenibacterium minor]RYC31997.1 hypothetical protein D3273_11280 [Lichenibacterium minor]